jgi:hypothetical protein
MTRLVRNGGRIMSAKTSAEPVSCQAANVKPASRSERLGLRTVQNGSFGIDLIGAVVRSSR